MLDMINKVCLSLSLFLTLFILCCRLLNILFFATTSLSSVVHFKQENQNLNSCCLYWNISLRKVQNGKKEKLISYKSLYIGLVSSNFPIRKSGLS